MLNTFSRYLDFIHTTVLPLTLPLFPSSLSSLITEVSLNYKKTLFEDFLRIYFEIEESDYLRGLNEVVSRMIGEVRRKEGEEKEKGREDKEKEKKKVRGSWKEGEKGGGRRKEGGGRRKEGEGRIIMNKFIF